MTAWFVLTIPSALNAKYISLFTLLYSFYPNLDSSIFKFSSWEELLLFKKLWVTLEMNELYKKYEPKKATTPTIVFIEPPIAIKKSTKLKYLVLYIFIGNSY